MRIIDDMAMKLSNMLKKHESSELISVNEITSDVMIPEKAFNIPPDDGQSVDEIVDEMSSGYLRACLEMSHRALTGQVDPMREGDLPHKMALLLANRMVPQRKWKATLPDDTPEEVKKTSRALKSLIASLSSDGEIIVDSTLEGMSEAVAGQAVELEGAGI